MVVSHTDRVMIYDANEFKKLSELPVKLFKSESRETIQVLSICKSRDENYLALISGRKLI